MKDNNIIVDKSKKFAVRIVKLYKYLTEESHEYVLSKQLLSILKIFNYAFFTNSDFKLIAPNPSILQSML